MSAVSSVSDVSDMNGQQESLRDQVFDVAESRYGAKLICKWPDKNPGYVVLIHPVSRKWFGLVADIPGRYIGLDNIEKLDILNVKADPLLVSSLLHEEGYHPAWHMNKEHWVTIRLDGSVSFEQIEGLLDMSFTLVG
ncbi:MmcQ/YjbR family DNA-binding protein [Adlercreutzia sp. ZJ141]|uniref:MmcQ/YjbR family DNA-binding protein n=1 Tax=Adlercreutzia sp. ZJ141 TaxID=2709406 RepID=UPI0013EB8286|nr:MmcQ/YjbR family DNA-binding protein [Adlercreutzia sp. ZJ141]